MLLALRNMLRDGIASGLMLGLGNCVMQFIWVMLIGLYVHHMPASFVGKMDALSSLLAAMAFFVIAYSQQNNAQLTPRVINLKLILQGWLISLPFIIRLETYTAYLYHDSVLSNPLSFMNLLHVATLVTAGCLLWWLLFCGVVKLIVRNKIYNRAQLQTYNNVMVGILVLLGFLAIGIIFS